MKTDKTTSRLRSIAENPDGEMGGTLKAVFYRFFGNIFCCILNHFRWAKQDSILDSKPIHFSKHALK